MQAACVLCCRREALPQSVICFSFYDQAAAYLNCLQGWWLGNRTSSSACRRAVLWRTPCMLSVT